MVFEAVGFHLEPGEALLLRGPNGTGKSTLLRLLAGFLAPVTGRMSWGGEVVATNAAEQTALAAIAAPVVGIFRYQRMPTTAMRSTRTRTPMVIRMRLTHFTGVIVADAGGRCRGFRGSLLPDP